MKQKYILALMIAAFALPGFGDTVPVDYRKKGGWGDPTSRPRVPARIPEVGVAYDSGTHELEVVCEAQTTGQVYLYDLDGTLEGYSSVLNCTIEVPATGTVHVLHIEGGTWTGDAKFTD